MSGNRIYRWRFVSLVAAFLLFTAQMAQADEVRYTDEGFFINGQLGPLPNDPLNPVFSCVWNNNRDNSTSNTVTVEYTVGDVPGSVYGGVGRQGIDGGAGEMGGNGTDANFNAVTVYNGMIETDVTGGFGGPGGTGGNGGTGGTGGTSNFNTVTVYGGEIGYSVDGAKGGPGGDGGPGGNGGSGGGASHNTIIIQGGSIGSDVFGASGGVGGQGGTGGNGGNGGDAIGNTITLYGGEIDGFVVAGDGGYGGTGSTDGDGGNASSNAVIIFGGQVSGLVAGGGGGAGGLTTLSGAGGDANNNTVIIYGGYIGGPIYGGIGGMGNSGGGDAAFNSVSIYGGVIGGDVFGGHGGYEAIGGNEIYNTVTLGGAPVFDTGVGLYGGNSSDLDADVFTGNTLNLHDYRGTSTLGTIRNFQNYNFILPASFQNGDTLLKATSILFGNADSSQASTITGLAFMNGSKIPQSGEVFTLIEADIQGNLTNEVNGDGQPFQMQGQRGIALLYDFELVKNPTALMATVNRVRINPQTKALSEGRMANMAFVNQGGDMVAGAGMDSAIASTNSNSPFSMFGIMSAGTSRYDSGSHVDVDGLSLLAGVGWSNWTEHGKLLLGAFFEAGWGSYDTYNSFSGYSTVKGDGDTEYYGGGILGRYDFAYGNRGNWYTDASFRAGWTETDFSTSDLRDLVTGEQAGYDSGAAYYGAHAGLGYVFNITDMARLDVYTKYLWTHHDSDTVRVAGDPVRFESADSHRWRGGARFGYTLVSESGVEYVPYGGAAYEYEFDSKAKAKTNGYSIDAPDLEGGTAMGELGLSIKPASSSPVTLDFGVQGHTGKREGVTGRLQCKLEF